MSLITRETDYALRALARLALDGGFMAVAELSASDRIPELFLRKTMQRLQQAQIVESRQGAQGGYRLAVPADQLSVLQVINAVQGVLTMNACIEDPSICDRQDWCPFHKALLDLDVIVARHLGGMNIAQAAAQLRGALTTSETP